MKDIEFAGRIGGMLMKFCDVPAENFHERWKPVRNAAGLIVGRASSEDHRWPAQDVPNRAQELTQKAIDDIHSRIMFAGGPRDLVEMIAKGLSGRVAEILVQMGEPPEGEDLPGALR